MRRVAVTLAMLVPLSALGCVAGDEDAPGDAVGTAAGEALLPNQDAPGEVVGTATGEVQDAGGCAIALSEEAVACGTAGVQGGVDLPNDAACAVAVANAVHACQ